VFLVDTSVTFVAAMATSFLKDRKKFHPVKASAFGECNCVVFVPVHLCVGICVRYHLSMYVFILGSWRKVYPVNASVLGERDCVGVRGSFVCFFIIKVCTFPSRVCGANLS
jgi:hypothetical protein